MNIFKIIDLSLKAKQGIEHPDELLAESSFAFIETIFIVAALVLAVLTLGLGFAAFYYSSYILLFFSILFLFSLSFDIWLYLVVKRFIEKISKKIVATSKEVFIDTKAKIMQQDESKSIL